LKTFGFFCIFECGWTNDWVDEWMSWNWCLCLYHVHFDRIKVFSFITKMQFVSITFVNLSPLGIKIDVFMYFFFFTLQVLSPSFLKFDLIQVWISVSPVYWCLLSWIPSLPFIRLVLLSVKFVSSVIWESGKMDGMKKSLNLSNQLELTIGFRFMQRSAGLAIARFFHYYRSIWSINNSLNEWFIYKSLTWLIFVFRRNVAWNRAFSRN